MYLKENFTYLQMKELVLNFSEEEQNTLQTDSAASNRATTSDGNRKRKAPSCKKCGQPMKGHPRGGCLDQS